MKLKVRKLHEDARLPTKATPGSVCYDVYSVEAKALLPMERWMIPTGLAFELPRWIGLDIRPRSGLASLGLVILNSPGTLDSDYRGELKISCINLSGGNFIVNKGDRIAQIRPFQAEELEFKEVEELTETPRGIGGFGSTGK